MNTEVLNVIYYQDIIIKKGIFLGLKNKQEEKINFFTDNYFYSKILPGDLVDYSINENNLVVINKILKREPFYSIGIISGYEDKKFYQKFEVFTPLLPTNYKLILKYGYKKYDIGDRVLLYFNDLDSNNNLKVDDVLKYNHIYDRKSDKSILINLYTKMRLKNLDDNNLINIKNNNINYYTKEEVVDLTHLNTFNIDPVHSKDFDDAISIDIENNKIYIHIVDINQIDINSNVDKKAAYLGYTLYLSEGNHNMLNNILSENKFSLIKDEERKVITIELDIDINGEPFENAPKVLKYEIYKSIIKVKDRFDYESVEKDDILNNKKDIKYLYDLTNKIYKRPISLPHPKYIINENGKIEKIILEDNSSTSHKMVEMLMILTNKLVTEHLNKYVKVPERYHDKTDNFNFENLENISIEYQLNEIIKLKTAVYDTQKTSHFALQLNNYCHFTSPIRRYFDIIIHRILGGYQYENLDKLIEHLNKREELNEKIVDLYNNWKLIDYFIDHPTKEFEAKIIKVSKSGIKFYIKELGFNGFIICKNILENIYWKYYPDEKILKGKTLEGKNYFIKEGDKVNVCIYDLNYMSHDSISWKIINLN